MLIPQIAFEFSALMSQTKTCTTEERMILPEIEKT